MSINNLLFPIDHRYYRYSYYISQKFGKKVFRIGLDCGFTCPVRDGKISSDGCLYCNNSSFAANRKKDIKSVKEQIEQTLRGNKFSQKQDTRQFFAYFQSYTNTYAPVTELEKMYQEALDYPEIVGLIVGTRPDCIEENILRLLKDISQDYFVSLELGIESVYDKTLKWVNRGHDFETTRRAIFKARKYNLNVSGHYIMGFPTETKKEMLESVNILNQLPITGIKLHNLHVVKATPMSQMYEKEKFDLFGEEEWIVFIADFLERLRPDIVIERLVGDALRETLIAPIWKTQKTLVLEKIRRELIARDSYQGKLYESR